MVKCLRELKLVNLNKMSVLYSDNGCQLISHKAFIDRVYKTVGSAQQISGLDLKRTFVLSEDVFDFHSNNQNDDGNKARHRKIDAKKDNISISKNPELHKLVSWM